MECKGNSGAESLWGVFRINRNIMECKGSFRRVLLPCCPVLIETLWNVKQNRKSIYPVLVFVLIETLWNVKHNEPAVHLSFFSVLIETLWNVKTVLTLKGVRLTSY